jgi:phage terminase Nu1 subunit (DNA packaging protein)
MRLVNRSELAEVFGVDVRTVTNWAYAGLPTFGHGHRRYDAEVAAMWLLGRTAWRLDIRDEELRAFARKFLEDHE